MNTLKAISLWQPWATFWARQIKINETRSWSTNYRGPLAVHAALLKTAELIQLCEQEPFKSALGNAGYSNFMSLPRGCIIAVCDGVECLSITNPHSPLPSQPFLVSRRGIVEPLSETEQAFGDFSDGRFAWKPKNMRLLPVPIPCRGAQQLWDVPPDIAAQAYAQLETP